MAEAPAALKYLHNNNEADNAVDHGITCRERLPVFICPWDIYVASRFSDANVT